MVHRSPRGGGGLLRPAVAAQYDVVRAKNRALVNVSVLGPEDQPARCDVDGSATNLLGQRQVLNFREVAEGPAVYYLAELTHDNEEVIRFDINIGACGSGTMNVKFQQKLYHEHADAGRSR